MRRVLGFLLIAAATIAIAWSIAGMSGNFDATIAGVTIEMPTPVALVALVVIVLLLHLALRLLFGVLDLPARFARWRARCRRAAGEKAVTRTLVALAAGDQRAAAKESARARRLLGDTAQTLLHAAEAARLAGNEDEATALFRLLAEREDAGFLGLRGLFRQAMAREDWPGAALLAQRAEGLRPGIGWLRAERSDLAVRTGNWQQAIALAGPTSPTAAFAAAAAEAEPELSRAVRMARRAWKDNPDFVPAALVYAGKLRQDGQESKAQSVLRDTWKHTPHPDLAALALAPFTDPAQRLKEGTRLAEGNPGDAESLFLLATLALAAGDHAEARHHAEAARNVGLNQQRLWKLFADIDASDLSGGGPSFPQREALRLATAAEADPGWRCESCGTAHGTWLPSCPSCHTPGRISWGTANRLALAP